MRGTGGGGSPPPAPPPTGAPRPRACPRRWRAGREASLTAGRAAAGSGQALPPPEFPAAPPRVPPTCPAARPGGAHRVWRTPAQGRARGRDGENGRGTCVRESREGVGRKETGGAPRAATLPPQMPERFVHRLRVRYDECDQQGVVFNSHYFAYFDVALTEAFRRAGCPYQEMTANGTDAMVAEAHARY